MPHVRLPVPSYLLASRYSCGMQRALAACQCQLPFWRTTQRRPYQMLKLRLRKPFGYTTSESAKMIAEVLQGRAGLDKVPVGECFCLGDLLGGQRGQDG